MVLGILYVFYQLCYLYTQGNTPFPLHAGIYILWFEMRGKLMFPFFQVHNPGILCLVEINSDIYTTFTYFWIDGSNLVT